MSDEPNSEEKLDISGSSDSLSYVRDLIPETNSTDMESLRLSTGNPSWSNSVSTSGSPQKRNAEKELERHGLSTELPTDVLLDNVCKLLANPEPILVESFEGESVNTSSEIVFLDESQKKTDGEPKTDDTIESKHLDSTNDISAATDDLAIMSDNPDRLSMNSDVQILDETPNKESTKDPSAENKSVSDSVEIISPDANSSLAVINDSNELVKDVDNKKDSCKLFKAAETGKFISPVFLTKNESNHVNFDATPVYSTPNETKPISNLKVPEDSDIQANTLGDSTESLSNLPSVHKKVTICVEVSTMLHLSKDCWTGELINLACEDLSESTLRRMSEYSSGHLADVSKSTSPSSSISSNLAQPYPLKPNRFSVVSTSSSSSVASSASTLARIIREGKLFTTGGNKDVILSNERIEELRKKWLNSSEIYKILDFIDKIIMNVDNVIGDDSLTKTKPAVEEPIKEKLTSIEEALTPVSTNKIRPNRGKRQAKVKFAALESDGEVPKKRQRRVESTEVPCISTNFSAGDSVFAKWGDRKFYAATLGEFTADGKWQVNFFDGDKKLLLEEFLIKAEEFTMVGHSVYASQGDDNFTPGIITGCELKDGVLQYIVARDKGDISVPCQFIYITESQARQIRGKNAPSSGPRTTAKATDATYGAGNKRSTRSKTRMLLDSPKPSSSGMQQAVLSDSDDDGNDVGNELNSDDVAGVEPESHGVYENGIKLKGKTVTGKMRFARAKASDTDATVLGPVPDEGSKFFKNLHVLLTCTRPQSPRLQPSDTNSSGNCTTDSESYQFSTIPFVKDRLKLQLQMGGATVYNSFDDIPSKFWKSAYLISNRPNISAKYIQCIAAGIKCICHEWVIRCCVDKKRTAIQELPLGWSLERERFFNSFDRKSSAALKKVHLLIVETGDKNFNKFWAKVCKLAEINVSKLTRDSNLEQVTAVLSEAGYRDDHVDRVVSHCIPVVTTTWLIQTLLHGEPRSFDAHKSYRADYVESD